MRLGILGGSFNPPHLGHLICAQEALVEVGLDQVVLMPAGVPPHKAIAVGDPTPEERYALCQRAVAGDRRFAVSRLELDRPGRSYTAETLRLLRTQRPADDLTFIVGGDMARTLPQWREPEAILALADLAVAEREGSARAAIEAAIAPLDGRHKIRFFAMPRIDLSSSAIRARVARGEPIRYLVPEGVAAAIADRGHYREPSKEVN